ncbi:MAG: hypothetical protein RRX92_01400 [Lachnospiraceae bacterium]
MKIITKLLKILLFAILIPCVLLVCIILGSTLLGKDFRHKTEEVTTEIVSEEPTTPESTKERLFLEETTTAESSTTTALAEETTSLTEAVGDVNILPVYILDTSAKVFHLTSCYHVADIAPDSYEEFGKTHAGESIPPNLREEIIAQGYQSCGNCTP